MKGTFSNFLLVSASCTEKNCITSHNIVGFYASSVLKTYYKLYFFCVFEQVHVYKKMSCKFQAFLLNSNIRQQQYYESYTRTKACYVLYYFVGSSIRADNDVGARATTHHEKST